MLIAVMALHSDLSAMRCNSFATAQPFLWEGARIRLKNRLIWYMLR
jgi:hypothetical protein